MSFELLLICIGGVLLGFAAARSLFKAQIASMQTNLEAREKAFKAKVRQLQAVRLAFRVDRATWGEIAKELPLHPVRRRLLLRLSTLLSEMAFPDSATTSLHGVSQQSDLLAGSSEIAMLVEDIGETRLALLWKEGSYESLHEMVHELVKPPRAANSSDFGELIEIPDIEGTVTSDFAGLQVTESFTPHYNRA